VNRASGAALIGVALLAAAGWLIERHPVDPRAPHPADKAVAVADVPVIREPGKPAADAQRDPSMVLQQGSLRGTAPDGDIHLGFGGRLQPDLALRRLFDYYLAMIGETGLDGIQQLLRADLQRRQIDPPASDEVMQAFVRYAAYQQALAVSNRQQSGTDLARHIAQIDALRVQYLGPALAAAFYGEQRTAEQQQLKRLAILNDPTLDAEQRAQALRQLDSSLPAGLRAERAQANTATNVQAQTAQLDASNATPAQRFEARAAQWGPEAATRLQALDQQRAQWQSRLDSYTQQRAAILNDNSLAPAQRDAALQSLLQRNFQGGEQQQVLSMQQAGVLGG
jgi:lipase chaperone LimK